MRKIMLGGVLLASSLMAGATTTVVPYVGVIGYDSSSAVSAKDSSKLYGIHASAGTVDYLIEFDYSKFSTNYKSAAVEDLDQDDIVLSYAKYYKNFMFKIGDHYISTNDPLLRNGNTIITAIGGYSFSGADKYSYGIEGYYSKYSSGQDENNVRKSIGIMQATPYFSFFKKFSKKVKNNFSFKYNYQSASDYVQNNYSSYEISDTIYYGNVFTTFKYYDGEMRSGVKDGGTTVMNTLDLVENGFDIKLGYYFSPKAVLTISYGENNVREFDVVTSSLLKSGKNSVTVATFSYTY
ncbi:hypothetical protein JHD48_01995 [Sulfurimonas sp. SAG-AH-194-I05]|nr:hypothetical protein [Sulfurimonas sp. SAG-AH-194-I05]MDF1874501.1 hypothetical protein [Sulfurimonas sp. SAG-AH-194-I05]